MIMLFFGEEKRATFHKVTQQQGLLPQQQQQRTRQDRKQHRTESIRLSLLTHSLTEQYAVMTRAFTPPDTLSNDDIRTIANVRRDIWTNSFKGMGVGLVTGGVLHAIANSRLFKVPGLNRNTAFLAVLGGGAFGSFLSATVTGKNQVHNLHPIFEVGKREVPEARPEDTVGTPYQQAMRKAQSTFRENEESGGFAEDGRGMVVTRNTYSRRADDDFERAKRRENRLTRRRTLQERFEQKGGGDWR